MVFNIEACGERGSQRVRPLANGPVKNFKNFPYCLYFSLDGGNGVPEVETAAEGRRPMANFANTMTVFRYQRGVENIHGHEEEMRKSAVKQGFVDILKQDDTEGK